MTIEFSKAKKLLDEHGQGDVLRFWDRLDEGQRKSLLAQVEDLDFTSLGRMGRMLEARAASDRAGYAGITPSPVVELAGQEAAGAREAGREALRAGQVGVVLVAGGQGSRLGFNGPKGCFPVGPLSDATLFAIHARKILASERLYDTQIPFYIMTSRTNDAATRDFFLQHNGFGLNPDRVKFFVQGMWPALWEDGRMVLDRPGHLFMSPDGHGGTLTALLKNGMLADMASRGIETVFYFQVDNPLVEIADPAFIGLHRLQNADMSLKVCAKRDPGEGLGVVAGKDGRHMIVEYTELTDEQKNERLPDGRLKFLYGSVAIHVFSRDFLQQEAEAELPIHLAHKKVPFCDEAGNTVKPAEPNAFKFEKFIFDVLPDAARSLNLAFLREDEFSPVKNATGSDSPATAQRDMIRKAGRWLRECGVDVPVDASGTPLHKIEIDPCYAASPEELKAKLPAGFRVDGDVLLA